MKNQLFKKERPNKKVPEAIQGSQEASGVDDLQACIAQRAYELYEHGGCCHGHDLDHWLTAEREILKDKLQKIPGGWCEKKWRVAAPKTADPNSPHSLTSARTRIMNGLGKRPVELPRFCLKARLIFVGGLTVDSVVPKKGRHM